MKERIEAILAQETLNEADIAFVMSHLDLVTEAGKIRLGLIPAKPATLEPAPVVETPKKVAKKVIKKK